MHILPGYRVLIFGVCIFEYCSRQQISGKNEGTYFRRGTYLRGFTVNRIRKFLWLQYLLSHPDGVLLSGVIECEEWPSECSEIKPIVRGWLFRALESFSSEVTVPPFHVYTRIGRPGSDIFQHSTDSWSLVASLVNVKERALQNKTFLYIKIPEVPLVVSYKVRHWSCFLLMLVSSSGCWEKELIFVDFLRMRKSELAEWSERLKPGRSDWPGWLGANDVGSIPALALSHSQKVSENTSFGYGCVLVVIVAILLRQWISWLRASKKWHQNLLTSRVNTKKTGAKHQNQLVCVSTWPAKTVDVVLAIRIDRVLVQ